MVPIKRRLNNKPIGVKCKALKDLEKGMTNKEMATKYDVLKNTLSTWGKNKHKLTISLEKEGMSSSQESTCCGSYNQIDKQFSTGMLQKEAKKFQLMGSYLKKKP